MNTPIDFDGINRAAVAVARTLLPTLIPGGTFRSFEYVVRNPCRDDRKAGSFTINYKTGVWKDFANNDGGSDIVSLVAYCHNCSQGDAARKLADKLGAPLFKPGHKPAGHNGANGPGSASTASAQLAIPTAAEATEAAPKIYTWGDAGPPISPEEIRRHFYPSSGPPMRVKIKKNNPEYPWTNYYRVFDNNVPVGWQSKKPDDYQTIPYRSTAIDPFDSEFIADYIFWPEGEKDVETLNKLNLPAFTFGGVGDGLPDGINEYLSGRHLGVLADNDDKGRAHAEKKAERAHAADAASIRIVHFPELPPKGDVSDFVENGGSAIELFARVEAAPEWRSRHVPQEQSERSGIRELVICRASEIEPEPISWLWPGRIAIGKQTLIAGEPGLGKSQLSIAIVAAVTTGGVWPGQEGRAPLGKAIILSAEDGVADTIVPRLMAAGADLSRVDIISAVRNENGGRRTFNLQADLTLLERHIEASKDVRFVDIDPLSSYMGAVDSHKNTDVRSVLEAVGEMAARHRVAILGITHFSKGAGQRAINAFIGSVAFIAAARRGVCRDERPRRREPAFISAGQKQSRSAGTRFGLPPYPTSRQHHSRRHCRFDGGLGGHARHEYRGRGDGCERRRRCSAHRQGRMHRISAGHSRWRVDGSCRHRGRGHQRRPSFRREGVEGQQTDARCSGGTQN